MRGAMPGTVALCLVVATLRGGAALAQEPHLQAIAEEVYAGRVVEVVDARSLLVAYGGATHRFRLDGVHCPSGAPQLAELAAARLRERLAGKAVQVRVRGYIEHGTVPTGVIALAGGDVRFDLVARGLVAYCPRYAVDVTLAKAARVAREEKRGIWASPGLAGDDVCAGAS